MNKKLIEQSMLQAGDIILCHGESKFSKAIAKKTDSNYTHAAICIDTKNVAESVKHITCGKVTITQINDLIMRYKYVAVLRHPDAWDSKRVGLLNNFINELVENEAKYNITGVLSFLKNKKIHNEEVMNKLHSYFNGNLQVNPVEKESYFCSELVANCFIATGFHHENISLVHPPEISSPIDLARNNIHGAFVGYILSSSEHQIPDTDYFYNSATFEEIYRISN